MSLKATSSAGSTSGLNPLTPDVRLASTANISGIYYNGPNNDGIGAFLTVTPTGALTVDGVLTVLNDNLLLKDQSTAAYNGVYVLTTAGATGVNPVLTRRSDFNSAVTVKQNSIITVEQGATQAGSTWVETAPGPFIVGTSAIAFSPFAAGVLEIIGTANEIIASSATGIVTLSTPQAIATTSSPTFKYVQTSVTDNITATGTNRATAVQLVSSINHVTDSGGGDAGVILPSALDGRPVTVINDGADNLNVYALGSTTINGSPATSGTILLPLSSATFYYLAGADEWVYTPFGTVDEIQSGFAGFIDPTNPQIPHINYQNPDWNFTDPTEVGYINNKPTLGTMSSQDADDITVTGGTIDGVTIGGTTPEAGTFTFVYESTAPTVSAAGTDQSDATALSAVTNDVTTVASGTGVKLPAAVSGAKITVYNNGANALQVYSSGSETINGVAGATGITLPVGESITFDAISTSAWLYGIAGGLGTMAYQDADSVAVTGGDIDGTTIGGTTPALGTFTFAQASASDNLTATGTDRSGALALTTEYNNITSTPSGTGVVLTAAVVGRTIVVFNNGGNDLQVYGNGSDTINNVAGATGVTLAATTSAAFTTVDSGAWVYAIRVQSDWDEVVSSSPSFIQNKPTIGTIASQNADDVTISGGTIDGTTINGSTIGGITPAAGAFTFVNGSVTNAITAAGTNRGTATVLTTQVNIVTAGAASTGVVLPSSTPVGAIVTLANYSNTPSVHVYAPGSGTINSEPGTTGVILDKNTIGFFTYSAADTWVFRQTNSYSLRAADLAQSESDVYTATYDNGLNNDGVGATLTNAGALAALTVDGTTPSVGQRVVMRFFGAGPNPSTPSDPVSNGVFTVTVVGDGSTPWVVTRATDFDNITKVSTSYPTIMVKSGVLYSQALLTAVVDSNSALGTAQLHFYPVKNLGFTYETGITATGTTNSDAYLLYYNVNEITTTPSGTGVFIDLNSYNLGNSINGAASYIFNGGANSLKIYTNGTAFFPGNIAGSTGITLEAGMSAAFYIVAGSALFYQPLGTLALQDAFSVTITGGTINGTTIGATTPTTGSFTFSRQSALDGITAAGTDQSTATALTNAINNITTVTSGTGVKLPVGVKGDSITVFNSGALALQIYSNGAETINGSSGATGINVVVGSATVFTAISNSAWLSGSATGLGTMAFQNANSVTISGGTIDGTDIGEDTPALGTFTFARQSAVDSLTATGTDQSDALALTNAINNVTTTASGTGVKLPAAVTGDRVSVYNFGDNDLTVYAAGSETLDGVPGSAGVAIKPTEALIFEAISTSAWVFQSLSSMAYQDSAGIVVTGGTMNGVTIGGSDPAAGTFTFARQVPTNSITAAGTNQGSATALTTALNNVTTTASGTGIKLPAAVAGDFVTVYNNGVNTLKIYSASTETINGGSGATGISLVTGSSAVFNAISSSAWLSESSASTGVTSIAGTTNQVVASASTGAVTLSLPQDIATTSSPTFGNVQAKVFYDKVVTANTGAAYTVDPTAGSTFVLTWNNDTIITVSNPTLPSGYTQTIDIVLIPDSGAGAYQLTFSGSINFVNNNLPLVDQTPGFPTVISLKYADGNWQLNVTATHNDTIIIPSANTIDFDQTGSAIIHVSGTVTINSIISQSGVLRTVVFDDAGCTIVYSGIGILLPSGADIVTQAGDTALFVGIESDPNSAVYCISYQRADGTALVQSGVTSATGTANQVLVNGDTSTHTGALTFTLPQDIATGSTVTFGNLNLGSGGQIAPTSGTINADGMIIGATTPETGNFTFAYQSAADSITAAGTDQSTATALTKAINNVTTVASNTGVKLPASVIGMVVDIYNNGVNGLHIYPNGSDTINGLGAGFPPTLSNGGKGFRFECVSAGTWIYAPIGTIAYQNSNNITVTGGLLDSVIIGGNTPLTGNFTFAKQVPATAITAAGTDQSTATALTAAISNITTTASGTGVKLPAIAAGQQVTVYNNGANDLQVYSNNTATINGISGATGITLTAGSSLVFDAISSSAWLATMVPGLGTMSTQNADNVNITGGSITGIISGYDLGVVQATSTTDLDATYDNGASGVGATLTANSNGVLIVDNYTVNLDEYILAAAQTNEYENGIFKCTDAGSVSTPFILERASYYDTSAKILQGTKVFTVNGSNYKNANFYLSTANPITVGSTDLIFFPDFINLQTPFDLGAVKAVSRGSNLTANYNNGTSGQGATLTSTTNATLTLDGQAIVNGDYVGIFSQTSQLQNGIYLSIQTGVSGGGGSPWILQRASYFDSPSQMRAGAKIIALTGTLYGRVPFYLDADVTTVGTSTITFQTINDPSLGTMAQQNADSVAIIGGSIDGTDIGLGTPGYIQYYKERNAQTGTTYTLAVSDDARAVTFNNASNVTVTLPQQSTTTTQAGYFTDVYNLGAGTVIFVKEGSETLNGRVTLQQNESCRIYRNTTTTWSTNFSNSAFPIYDLGSVKAVTTGTNLTSTYSNGSSGRGATLTSTTNTTLTLDGQPISSGDYVGVFDQTTIAQNGIYLSTQTGSGSLPWILTRAKYFDSPATMKAGCQIVALTGNLYGQTPFYLSGDVATVGTSGVIFATYTPQGIGSMAYQDSTSVDITGGVIDGTVIGSVTQANAQFYTPVNVQTGTTYTLAADDCGKLITFNNSSAITVTLPKQATVTTSTGFWCRYENIGAGTVTFVTESGDTSKGHLTAITDASGYIYRNTTTSWLLSGGSYLAKGVIPFFYPGTIANTTGYYITTNAPSAFTLDSVTQVTGSLGTAGTYTVTINGTSVTGLTTIANATSRTTTNASGANSVSGGDYISFVLDSTVAAVNYYMQANYSYYINV